MVSGWRRVLLWGGMWGVFLMPATLSLTGLQAGAQPGSGIVGPHVEPPAAPTTVHPAELLRGGEHPRPAKPFLHPGGQDKLDREKAAAELLGPGGGIQTTAVLGALTPSAGIAFDGISAEESFCNCFPPDGAVAAGPNHLVGVVNTAFKAWTKGGALLAGPTSLNNLFASNASCLPNVSDPFAGYDAAADRFVLGALTYDSSFNSSICIAVSQTGNPTGAWSVYGFSVTPSNDLLDFPHAAIGSDAIYLAGNQFLFNGVTFTFAGARVYAYNKGAMYAGMPASSVFFNVGNNAAGHLADSLDPALAVGVPGTAYFLAADNCNGCSTISLWKWSTPFGASSFTLRGGVPVTPYSQPPNAKQLGGSRIATNDTRDLGAYWSSSTVYGTHTIGCNPGSGTVACVQWYQLSNLDTGTPTLV